MKLYEVLQPLFENKIEYIAKQQGEKIKAALQADSSVPSAPSDDLVIKTLNTLSSISKKYLQWLVNRYTRNEFRINEDLEVITEALNVYEQWKKDIGPINNLSLPQLYDAIRPYKETNVDSEKERNLISSGQAEVIYDQGNERVIIPRTYAASEYFAKEKWATEWCTKAKNMYEHYTKDGPLYMIEINDGEEVYQVHWESEQIMDRNDNNAVDLVKKFNSMKFISDKKSKELMLLYEKEKSIDAALYMHRNSFIDSKTLIQILSKNTNKYQLFIKYSARLKSGEYKENLDEHLKFYERVIEDVRDFIDPTNDQLVYQFFTIISEALKRNNIPDNNILIESLYNIEPSIGTVSFIITMGAYKHRSIISTNQILEYTMHTLRRLDDYELIKSYNRIIKILLNENDIEFKDMLNLAEDTKNNILSTNVTAILLNNLRTNKIPVDKIPEYIERTIKVIHNDPNGLPEYSIQLIYGFAHSMRLQQDNQKLILDTVSNLISTQHVVNEIEKPENLNRKNTTSVSNAFELYDLVSQKYHLKKENERINIEWVKSIAEKAYGNIYTYRTALQLLNRELVTLDWFKSLVENDKSENKAKYQAVNSLRFFDFVGYTDNWDWYKSNESKILTADTMTGI